MILALWEGAFRVVQWKAWVFPAPSHVIDAMLGMLNIRTSFGNPISTPGWPRVSVDAQDPVRHVYDSPLVVANLVSLARLAAGFGISIAIGIVVGLAMWRGKGLDEFLGPPLLGVQTLPSVCWVPMAILVLGINEYSILFVLVMGSFAAVAISLRDGLRVIPPLYPRAGLMLGAKGWRLYRYVLLPASLPAVAASLRQGFSFAWRSLMGAELLFAVQNHGLGFQLEMARNNIDIAQVIAVMSIMVLIGIAADRFVFARLERRVLVRFGLLAGA